MQIHLLFACRVRFLMDFGTKIRCLDFDVSVYKNIQIISIFYVLFIVLVTWKAIKNSSVNTM